MPYVVWSLAYFLAVGDGSPFSLVKSLLTGTASAQLYYLLVYAQLVLLTPWLYRMLRRCRPLMYAITPMTLVVREALAAAGLPSFHLGSLFATWLIFYLVGLDWDRIKARIRASWMVAALVVALALQLTAGMAWNAFGSYDMATTQLKLSSMLTSLCVIALFMLASDGVRMRLAACRPLTLLGDLSFGVYLCHIGVLLVVQKVFAVAGFVGFAWAFSLWVVTLLVSAAGVWLCQRILPRPVLSVVGFV